MKLRVVVVEPQYEENLGSTARAMKNFGFSELFVVSPKIRVYSGSSRSRAMHAQGILGKAKIVRNLEEALQGVQYAVATSARITKQERLSRTALSAREFAEKFSGKNAKVAIVFGREDTGLRNSEIEKCDFIVHVPTHQKYKTMNLAAAAAIIFYEISNAKKSKKNKNIEFKSASAATKKLLIKKFRNFIKGKTHIKDKKKIETAFKALVGRALISEKEAKALLSVFEKKNRKK